MDTIRVLRVIEYVGPRIDVERTLAKSLQDKNTFGALTVTVKTVEGLPQKLPYEDPQ